MTDKKIQNILLLTVKKCCPATVKHQAAPLTRAGVLHALASGNTFIFPSTQWDKIR